MEEKQTTRRVRVNLSQTAKGRAQIDCTAQFESVAECETALDEAIKAARRVMAANGMKEVHE